MGICQRGHVVGKHVVDGQLVGKPQNFIVITLALALEAWTAADGGTHGKRGREGV